MSTQDKLNMLQDKYIAVFLMVTILGVFVAISHHPVAVGGSLSNVIASIRQQGALDQLVHGSIMVLLILLSAAMALFSDRLSRFYPAVIAAITSYLLGIGLTFVAMGFDGFVLPALAEHCTGDAAGCAERLKSVLALTSEVVQVFTRLGFMATALAILLWSVHLIFIERRTVGGILGFLSVAMQLAALATLAVRLTPHSLLIVLSGQLIWYGVVAGFFWFGAAAINTAPLDSIGRV